MVDLKDLRENPDKYRQAAQKKRIAVDIDSLVEMENQRRSLDIRRQQLTAEKNAIGKQIGQEGIQLAMQLARAGRNPIATVYQMAQAYGYRKEQTSNRS